MPTAQLAAADALREPVDAIKESVDRLERLLPAREDSQVLLDFLEDDLREGLDAISEVEDHFSNVLETLKDERVSPVSLLDAAEDFRVLNRLEYLMVVVGQMRRRLLQAAGKMRNQAGLR